MRKKILIILIILLVITVTSVFASTSNIDGIGDITTPFQRIIDILRGPIVLTLAVLAIIGIGLKMLISGKFGQEHKVGIIVVVVALIIIIGGAKLVAMATDGMEVGSLANTPPITISEIID